MSDMCGFQTQGTLQVVFHHAWLGTLFPVYVLYNGYSCLRAQHPPHCSLSPQVQVGCPFSVFP